jgi:succinate dehydrogenase / fumarate reductase cytochrome b subunit
MKGIMAISGAGLLVFVIVHMLGNLLVFGGPELLNSYAHTLKSSGGVVWGARLGLLAMVIFHVVIGFKLTLSNKEARPVAYKQESTVTASIQSRTMIISGALLFAFVVYHLLHFTVGVVEPDSHATNTLHLYDLKGEMVPNVYFMVVEGFTNPLISASYIVAMILLGMHLSHGISSIFQSLGLSNKRYRFLQEKAGVGLATIIVVGNISMPVAVFLGIIKHSSGA